MATSTITKDFLVDTFDAPEFNVTTGTPGTYQTILEIDIAKSGYQPIACSLTRFGHPGTYIAIPTFNGNKVNIIIFRAVSSTGSFAKGDVQVRVVYRKVYSQS